MKPLLLRNLIRIAFHNIRLVISPQVYNLIKKAFQKKIEKDYNEYEKRGCPVPPPHIIKQMTITEYQNKYRYDVFIETGTFFGDMVEAQKKRFARVISIELGVKLFNKATKRFRKDENVTIVFGDSGKVLPKILLEINEPVIFWLDGHYSEGVTASGETKCPIFQELDAIFNRNEFNHILLIDDARCFDGEGDYPSISQLIEYVQRKNENYQVEIKNDIIRFSPTMSC